jgi:hypothetical protein
LVFHPGNGNVETFRKGESGPRDGILDYRRRADPKGKGQRKAPEADDMVDEENPVRSLPLLSQ